MMNDFEVLRNGLLDEMDILNPYEQSEILGGDTVIHCNQGYSKSDNKVKCNCGYSIEETEEETDPVPTTEP